MARKTATFAYCDGINCKVSMEVSDAGNAPEGWYRVDPEKDGKFTAHNSWEFHSLTCLSRWAKERNAALLRNDFTRSTPIEVKSSRKLDRDEIIRRDTALEDAMDVLMSEKGSFTVTEICDLSGVEKSYTYRYFNSNRERFDMVEDQRGTIAARYSKA